MTSRALFEFVGNVVCDDPVFVYNVSVHIPAFMIALLATPELFDFWRAKHAEFNSLRIGE